MCDQGVRYGLHTVHAALEEGRVKRGKGGNGGCRAPPAATTAAAGNSAAATTSAGGKTAAARTAAAPTFAFFCTNFSRNAARVRSLSGSPEYTKFCPASSVRAMAATAARAGAGRGGAKVMRGGLAAPRQEKSVQHRRAVAAPETFDYMHPSVAERRLARWQAVDSPEGWAW